VSQNDDIAAGNWYRTFPSLEVKVGFLAWKHRRDSPIIIVKATSIGADSVPTVLMVPRTQWDADDELTGVDLAITARSCFGKKDFNPDKVFMVLLSIDHVVSGAPYDKLSMRSFPPETFNLLHPSVFSDVTADDFAAEIARREKESLRDAVFVRLVGLRSAAHLNGQEGVLKGLDPKDPERSTVRLNNGKDVGVLSHNFEAVTRPPLFLDEFPEERIAPTENDLEALHQVVGEITIGDSCSNKT
jgi:hypothetical protein